MFLKFHTVNSYPHTSDIVINSWDFSSTSPLQTAITSNGCVLVKGVDSGTTCEPT